MIDGEKEKESFDRGSIEERRDELDDDDDYDDGLTTRFENLIEWLFLCLFATSDDLTWVCFPSQAWSEIAFLAWLDWLLSNFF